MASPSPTAALLGDGRQGSIGSAIYGSNEPRNPRIDTIINAQAQGAQPLPGLTSPAFETSSPLSIDMNFGFMASPQDSSNSNSGIDAPPELRRAQGQTMSTLNSMPAGAMVNMSSQQPPRGSFTRLDSAFEREMLNHPGRSNATPLPWTPSTSAGRPPSSPDEPPRATAMNDTKISTNSKKKETSDGVKRPAWSELKTKAGKERKRLPLACIVCRRKKIRCSGEKPACKHCLRARVPCVYKVTTRKAAPRTDYMAMLDKRLKRMEDRVIKAIPKDELPDLSQTGRASVRPPLPGGGGGGGQAPSSATTAGAGAISKTVKPGPLGKKRSADEAFTKELDEWTSLRQRASLTDQRSGTGTATGTGTTTGGVNLLKQREGEENKLSTEGLESLPSQHMQEHLAEVFFDCVYGQSYLLLHKPSFMRKLKAGTVPPVLTLAMCAISARFSTHPQVSTEPAFLRGEQWATPARRIIERRHYEPNITILIAMLMLGMHYFGTCEGGLSWSFGGQAMRMGYALQLHRELDHDPLGRDQIVGNKNSTAPSTGPTNTTTTTSNNNDNSGSSAKNSDNTGAKSKQTPASQSSGSNKPPELSFTDREIRRRTMWACYLMDTFNSSGTERPSFLNEEYMQIQLPIKEENFQMEVSGPTEDLEGNIPLTLAGTYRSARTGRGTGAGSGAETGGASGSSNPATLGADEMRLAATAKSNMGVASYIIRAVVIWKRIVKYLNLGGKDRDPHRIWNASSQFVSLQRSITNLKSSLPEHLTYTQKNLDTHASLRLANQFLFLHIVMAQTSLFLHRFAIPSSPHPHTHSQPWHFLDSDMPRNFLASSATTVLKSAEEITTLIGASAGHTLTVPFAGYCAYASATVHVWGIFGRNEDLAVRSKEALSTNYQYLTRMKRYWGMFYYMAESVKEAYRRFADAAMRQGGGGVGLPLSRRRQNSSEAGRADGSANGENAGGSPLGLSGGDSPSSPLSTDAAGGAEGSEGGKGNGGRQMFQYGDWFDKYPHGVSESEWESSHLEYRKDGGQGSQAVMSQQSDLLSVEEFFASLSRARTEEEHGPGGRGQDKSKKGKTTRKRRKSTVEGTAGPNSRNKDGKAKTAKSGAGSQQQQQQQQQQQDRGSMSGAPGLGEKESASGVVVRGRLSTTHPDPNQQSIDLTPFPNEFDLTSPNMEEFQMSQSAASDPFLDGGSRGGSGSARGAMQYSYTHALPHLDRQMVFGAYADIDPSTMLSHSLLNPGGAYGGGNGGGGGQQQQQQQQQNQAPDAGGVGNLWAEVDLNGFSFGEPMGGGGGGSNSIGGGGMFAGGGGVGSNAWMIPFNIDPPSFMMTSGGGEEAIGGGSSRLEGDPDLGGYDGGGGGGGGGGM